MGNHNRLTRATRKIAATTIIVAALSGCAQTTDWIKETLSIGSSESSILGAPNAKNYLKELGRLAGGDPAAQAEIYADATAVAELTPGTSANLRLGLVLATPGHPESNPEKAQGLLREVLTQTLLLTPSEINLATIHLNYVERLLVVNAESRRLRASSSRAAQTEQRAINQRLEAVDAENRQLRQDLEEAGQKLEAITSIERSIREQE